MVATTKRRRIEIIAFERERIIAAPMQMPCTACHAPSEFLPTRLACRLAQVKPQSLYRWLQHGKAHGVRTAGGEYRICRNSLFRPLNPALKPRSQARD